MPADTDLAARIEATMARRAKATSVDSISVDKDVLDALYEGWRCWQMVEGMPRFQALKHDYCWGKDRWAVRNTHMGDSGPWLPTPAAALHAAREEGTDAT